jgi:hypothetical protein
LVSTKELKLNQYRKRLLKKLKLKFLGLYRVLECYGENTYKLNLRNLLFHSILNTSQLVRYRDLVGVMEREKRSVTLSIQKVQRR